VKAVVLVGGEGTRLRPLTYLTVKAMVPVLNKPFLEYTIRYLSHHNVQEIILAIGYKPDLITEYFSEENLFGAKLIYSIETEPLGTAGAVKNAQSYIDDRLFIMNGDIFTDINITDMLQFHENKSAKVTIALTPVEDPTRFGVVETDNDHRVTRFVEKPRREEVTSNMINAGLYIVEREILERIPEGQRCMFEHNIFPSLVNEGEPVYGFTTDAYWMDTGTPEKYLQLNFDLLRGKSTQVDFKETDVHIDKQSHIHSKSSLVGPVLIDRDCNLGEEVELRGPVVIGSGCRIDDGAIIEDSVLWKNITVGRKAALKECIVANNSYIQDNVHMRGAVIASMDDKVAFPNKSGGKKRHGRKHK
jgi:mannose-1-phosphate guanylyltransferase